MKTVASRTGGRPRLIAVDDVLRVGRELGMRRLSVNAVAAQLGVSATALYRHVESRWALERLVGESLLAELELSDDPDDDIEHICFRSVFSSGTSPLRIPDSRRTCRCCFRAATPGCGCLSLKSKR